MRPEDRDLGYLWDMRDAARDVVEFVNGLTFDQFCLSKITHSAVERRLEVLGEAAGRVSEAFQTEHQEISWKEIKGIRVVLAHRYGTVDLSRLWQAAIKELPELIVRLDAPVPQVNED